MSTDDDIEHGGDDALAGEFVLGVLSASEHAAAAERAQRDPAFAACVEAWEQRLSPLAEAYEPVAVPRAVKQALDARLFGDARAAAPESVPRGRSSNRTGLWSSLALWRGLAGAAMVALAVALVVPRLPHAVDEPQPRLVASLAADGSAVRYLAFYDRSEGDIRLSHLAGDREAGRDFELWMIEGDKPPVSVGVIPMGSSTFLALDQAARARLAAGAVLAISVEPPGGSPTGQPTGPVVAAGDLRSI